MFGQAGTLLNPKAGFSPRSISGLRLWLAANQSPFTLNSGKISQWDDLSGLGNHATQATATLQPAYNTSGINGLPSIEADAVDDVIQCSAAFADTNIVEATQKAIIVVFRTGTVGVNDRIACGVTGGSTHWGPFVAASSNFDMVYRTSAPATVKLTWGTTLANNTTYITALRHDGASVKAYMNSLTAYATAANGMTTPPGAASGPFDINRATGARVAEALVYSGRAITDAEFNQTMNYLASKYGVTLA